ncbi:nuclear transport factor 2 family protein [Aquimarina sp. RZ0]|uniref:nuclear transport factor 2 family protein n=1 Tax=Aquimarina sp. RZ0 TaxID=2607730 RepID=UPI0011F228E6|nr:nuclear transport factor 2 family protein [Aquimarina sp. RZ0]KAA1243978.1 nuclear transport factor 2 family protein [Aquimarina sp. RZ0]
MKNILLVFFLLFTTSIFSQNKIDENQKAAKQAVLDFFEGFHKGDTTKMRTVIDKNVAMQTIVKSKEGKLNTVTTNMHKFLLAIHNRPKDQKWLEKLLEFKIDANADIAQIWTPYEFYVNNQFSHCGVNVFQLFNDDEGWKIIAIADTRKKEGCK